MKKNTLSFIALTASAILAASALSVTQSAAQSGQPEPAATPIPIDAEMPAVSTAVVKRQAPASPDLLTWVPASGFLQLPSNRQISVSANSTIPFDTTFHKFVLFDSNGTPLAAQDASRTYSNGNQTVNLVATVPAGTFTGIVFQVKDTNSGSILESVKYSIGRPIMLPFLFKEYVWPPLNLDATEPTNDNQCSATGPLKSSVSYGASFKSATDSDWNYIDVNANASLRVSANNVPVPNQMQLFVSTTGDCSGIPGSPTQFVADSASPSITLNNLPASRVYIRMTKTSVSSSDTYTLIADLDATSGTFEDNDNPCQATKTVAGTKYTTISDDTYDFFELNVPQSGNVKLLIENFSPASQLQLRSTLINSNCDPLNSTTRIGDAAFIVSGRAEINAFLNAGVYYARMGPPNPGPSNQAYNFTWTFAPGSISRKIETCPAFVDCYGDATSNKFTLYWRGMTANTEIRVSFSSTATGNCPKSSAVPGAQQFSVGANASGSREITNVPQGFYVVSTWAYENGVEVYRNEAPLKMDCNIALSNLSAPELVPEYGPIAPTPAP